MSHAPSGDASPVRYEPPDKPPHLLSFGMAAQFVTVTIAGIVLTPLIVIRAADQSDSYLSWAVFAALLVAGLTTILQAVRVGRFGAGYVLLMGTSGAFIAVCITALTEGGPALLATLVVASSLFQFLLASRLSLLRRIITPPVAGTVIMLISVTIMPILFDMMSQVQESGSAFADWLSRALGNPSGAFGAGVTMAVIVAIVLRGSGVWRLWAPVIGVIAGSLASGRYDVGAVASAAWFGLTGPSAPRGREAIAGPATAAACSPCSDTSTPRRTRPWVCTLSSTADRNRRESSATTTDTSTPTGAWGWWATRSRPRTSWTG